MSIFAHTVAAMTAANSTPALPDSVTRNARSGAVRARAHAVFAAHAVLDEESATVAHRARAYAFRRGDHGFHFRGRARRRLPVASSRSARVRRPAFPAARGSS